MKSLQNSGGGNRRASEAASRVAAILRVATKLFLKQGYARASLNDVVAIAGGSKATLRKYFTNKAGLFSAVIADVSAKFVADAHLRELQGDPEQVLREFGEIVLRFYLAHDSLTAYRAVVAEGHGSPVMAKSFYEQGHKLVQAALAERLDAWNHDGLIATKNSMDLADLFLHLIRAGLYEQRLIGLRKEPGKEEISARITIAVRLFLHGISPVPTDPTFKVNSARV